MNDTISAEELREILSQESKDYYAWEIILDENGNPMKDMETQDARCNW